MYCKDSVTPVGQAASSKQLQTLHPGPRTAQIVLMYQWLDIINTDKTEQSLLTSSLKCSCLSGVGNGEEKLSALSLQCKTGKLLVQALLPSRELWGWVSSSCRCSSSWFLLGQVLCWGAWASNGQGPNTSLGSHHFWSAVMPDRRHLRSALHVWQEQKTIRTHFFCFFSEFYWHTSHVSGHPFTHTHVCASLQLLVSLLFFALPHFPAVSSFHPGAWKLHWASARKLLPAVGCDRLSAAVQLFSGFCSLKERDQWGKADPCCWPSSQAVTWAWVWRLPLDTASNRHRTLPTS